MSNLEALTNTALWVDLNGVAQTPAEMSNLTVGMVKCLLNQPGLQDDLGSYNSGGSLLSPKEWREVFAYEQAKRSVAATSRELSLNLMA